MELNKRTFQASASGIESSDLYMTVKTVLFTSPSANLNGVRCSREFLMEIVENQANYVGLPLCIDTKMIAEGRLDKLGHCYDANTDTFYSTMIGSFYRFEAETLNGGELALVGYARVLKRNRSICKALSELFIENRLKFSFEISCGACIPQDDGTILIDRDELNHIEGMAVVSMPACPEAVAMELVAELENLGKETEAMEESIQVAEVIEEVAEVTPVEETPVVAEVEKEIPEEEEKECAAVEPVEDDAKEEECAAAEPEEKEPEEEPEDVPEKEEPEVEEAKCKKKCAEEEIAELRAMIAALQADIAALKVPETIIAEVEEPAEEIVAEEAVAEEPAPEPEPAPVVVAANPFVEDMVVTKKYSLLDDVKPARVSSYTLI